MKFVFRWFGEKNDPVSLAYIKQIPCVEGVVTSLLDMPAGELWRTEDIEHMKTVVNGAGLTCEVIESVNVHENIKLGAPDRDLLIENYIETMRRLSKIGVKVICYNFMPVLDWARSHLRYRLPDGSSTMYFDRNFISGITPKQLADRYAEECGGIAQPGWEPERLVFIEEILQKYSKITQDQYFENAAYFINRITPYAEELNIKMAIHPDDPPWSIFGLPRLINDRGSIRRFLDINSSPCNGITLCTGSLGADTANDVPGIAAEFASRIHFAHIRNLKHEDSGNFYESAHPTACGSLDMLAIAKALKKGGFDGYIRPDHGRMIWGETGRSGYGLFDRALGVTYLAGLFEAI